MLFINVDPIFDEFVLAHLPPTEFSFNLTDWPVQVLSTKVKHTDQYSTVLCKLPPLVTVVQSAAVTPGASQHSEESASRTGQHRWGSLATALSANTLAT